MKLWIKVEKGRITDIKFKSFGCPGAIATSSMVTHLARGRSLEQAMGLEPRTAQGSIRFSLGHYNTAEEIDQTVDAMARSSPARHHFQRFLIFTLRVRPFGAGA